MVPDGNADPEPSRGLALPPALPSARTLGQHLILPKLYHRPLLQQGKCRLKDLEDCSLTVFVFLSLQDSSAIDVVQYILQSCLLRREKDMRDRDGQLIVELPEKKVRFSKNDQPSFEPREADR